MLSGSARWPNSKTVKDREKGKTGHELDKERGRKAKKNKGDMRGEGKKGIGNRVKGKVRKE